MKKFILHLLLLVPMLAQAFDYKTDDGICFNVEGGEATITYLTDPTEGYYGSYSDNFVIPSTLEYEGTYTVTRIGEYAFYNCRYLTSVTIPDGVTSIGDNAFQNCPRLTSVTIPSSVTSIGDNAFQNCPQLASIIIPDGVTSIGDNTFSGCSSLTSINIPAGVTSIGQSAFAGCSGLTSIIVPDGVTSIGQSAFSGCSGLTSIDIPDGVTSIGDNTFSGCSGLTGINIPDGVASIGDNTFSGCSGLTSINIPDGVTSIGDNTFSGCSGLTGIIIPDGVTSIGQSAFSACSGLTSINIPDGVASIGDNAFSDCFGLTSIIIPDRLTSIGDSVFYACSSLTSITIPGGVTSIGKHAFRYCSGLTSINFPDGVASIGAYAFCNCSGLTNINIPDGVTSIGEYAFGGCSSLTEVYCYATDVPSGTSIFSVDNIRKATLYVPDAALANYSNTSPWTAFRDIIPLSDTRDTDVTGLADVLYVESQQFVPGAEIEVPLLLKNALEATGFSCTLVLPEGLSIVTDDDGYPDVAAVSERFSNMNYVTCYGDFNAEGNVDISCNITNPTRCKLTGNNGAVATFKLRAANKLEKGPYLVVLRNIRITNAESTAIDKVTVTFNYGKKWECTHIQGDVNGDGQVSIGDLNHLVNILLGK